MKYFIDCVTQEVFGLEDDGSQDFLITEVLRPMTEQEITNHVNPEIDPSVREQVWVIDELGLIKNQLLLIEDGDPTALPGTDRQWRDYRIQLRAWVEGAVGFPDPLNRPVRPA